MIDIARSDVKYSEMDHLFEELKMNDYAYPALWMPIRPLNTGRWKFNNGSTWASRAVSMFQGKIIVMNLFFTDWSVTLRFMSHHSKSPILELMYFDAFVWVVYSCTELWSISQSVLCASSALNWISFTGPTDS